MFTRQPSEKPRVGYNIHEAIYETKYTVPQKLKQPIEDIIGAYFEYCNNKEYEKAYNMLSDDYRNNSKMTLETFTNYIDMVFTKKKIYNIQNFSNIEDAYIYNLRILDDIMATGLTGQDKLLFLEEKVIIKEEKGQLRMSIGGFVGSKEIGQVYENEHMKITVISKIVKYDTETYLVNIANRTDKTIVLMNFAFPDEITLDIGDVDREYTNAIQPVTIRPEGTLKMEFTFDKFADDRKNYKVIEL